MDKKSFPKLECILAGASFILGLSALGITIFSPDYHKTAVSSASGGLLFYAAYNISQYKKIER